MTLCAGGAVLPSSRFGATAVAFGCFGTFRAGILRVSGHFDAGDTVALNYGFEPRWVPLENRGYCQ